MRPNNVKKLWKSKKAPSVAWLSTADTYVAETIANAGFDALVLDMQHGMAVGPDRAGLWLQAVSTTNAVPFVRVPWNEPFFIQWVLDAGAYGIIVPLVNNLAEATKAAGACRYPPAGYRSLGPNRARYYGGADYSYHSNEEVVCLVMIEDIKTVDGMDELVKAPGIDGFYIGPTDLALSMGIDPATFRENEEHSKACQKVLDAARKNGLAAGIHCFSLEETVKRNAQGFNFCPSMNDITALASEANKATKTFGGVK